MADICPRHRCLCVPAGIPMEEEDEEPDMTIRGRLMVLLYKIKGQPLRTEQEPKEKELAAPSKSRRDMD